MAETQGTAFIQRVQTPTALGGPLLVVPVLGLTAAAGATARAGHDLHEIVVYFAGCQGFQQAVGVAQAVDHGGAYHGTAAQVEFRFGPALDIRRAPHGGEGFRLGILSVD